MSSDQLDDTRRLLIFPLFDVSFAFPDPTSATTENRERRLGPKAHVCNAYGNASDNARNCNMHLTVTMQFTAFVQPASDPQQTSHIKFMEAFRFAIPERNTDPRQI